MHNDLFNDRGQKVITAEGGKLNLRSFPWPVGRNADLRERLTPKELCKRVGHAGWARYSGLIETDENPAWTPYEARGLIGSQGTVQRMLRTDNIVRGVTDCQTEILAGARLSFDAPKKATDLEKYVCEFVQWNFDDELRGGTSGLMESAALYLPYGFWLMERDYRRKDTKYGLKYVLEGLEDRLPQSIESWIWRDDGTLWGVQQAPGTDGQPGKAIPLSKLCLWTNRWPEAGPEGISALRAAYFVWRLKQEILTRDAGAWEKYGFGVAIARQVEKNIGEGALEAVEKALAEYAAHMNGYLVGHYGFELDVIFPAHTAPDPTDRINMLNREIVVGSLATWVYASEGARNLSIEQLGFFMTIMQRKARYIADVINTGGRLGHSLVRQLVDLNFATPVGFRYPKARVDGIEREDVDAMTKRIFELTQGKWLNPEDDPEVKDIARRYVGVPARGE